MHPRDLAGPGSTAGPQLDEHDGRVAVHMHDVADRAGVSVATVDRVINGRSSVLQETRDRVHEAISTLGYISHKAEKSGSIALPAGATIRELAELSGVSIATIDRVMHNRVKPRDQTISRINSAIETLARSRGKAPERYRFHLITSAEYTFPELQRAALARHESLWCLSDVSVTFHMVKGTDSDEVAETIRRLVPEAEGFIVDLRDTAPIRAAVDYASNCGKPTITTVSDVTECQRIGFVGPNNVATGRTAALLVGKTLVRPQAKIALVVGRAYDRCLNEREMGFSTYLRENHPNHQIIEIIREGISDRTYLERLIEVVATHPDLDAIYSVGGPDQEMAQALRSTKKQRTPIFVGHEVSEDQRWMLSESIMDFGINQDLDLTVSLCVEFLVDHLNGRKVNKETFTAVNIVTAENMDGLIYSSEHAVNGTLRTQSI